MLEAKLLNLDLFVKLEGFQTKSENLIKFFQIEYYLFKKLFKKNHIKNYSIHPQVIYVIVK